MLVRDVDEVLEDNLALQVIAIWRARRRAKAGYGCFVDPVAARHSLQDSVVAQLPKEDFRGPHEARHALA